MRIGYRTSAALGALLVAVSACGTGPENAVSPETSPDSQTAAGALPEASRYADELFHSTNEARVAEGLEPLTPSACGEQAALDRAGALVGQELEHAPLKPVLEACGTNRAAENLVDSAAPPHEVVDAWMGSPGHRNNIVDGRWTRLGIACVEHDAELLCSQIFLP
ncbi:CAP domain-containing protein [Georgenia soli]|uniref:CAP domain-containing protein n=1 Tax=Georgenia soli TaxID=638953 RepID=UPI000BF68D66|nr:CAP domain-containing protein [Georgenia soli]